MLLASEEGLLGRSPPGYNFQARTPYSSDPGVEQCLMSVVYAFANSLHCRDRRGENVHQGRKQARWAHEVTLSFELLYADVLSSHRSSLPRHNRRDCARSFAVMGLPT